MLAAGQRLRRPITRRDVWPPSLPVDLRNVEVAVSRTDPPFEARQRKMPGVWFRCPYWRMQTHLPRGLPHFRIGNVVADVRHLLSLGVAGPKPLRSAEIGNPGIRAAAGPGQDQQARVVVDEIDQGVCGHVRGQDTRHRPGGAGGG